MRNSYLTAWLILLAAQLVLCNYFHVTPLLTLSILPAMILCLPARCDTLSAMFIAFGAGLLADTLADGVIGLNAVALVPVAYVRRDMVRFIFGEEVVSRGRLFSVGRNGFMKVSFALLLSQGLFLLVYILCDGGTVRPLWQSAARFGCSLVAGWLLSLPVANVLAPDQREQNA